MSDLPGGVVLPAGVAPPPQLGGAVVAVEELKHHKGNAATGGIWRVRSEVASAVLKIARPPQSGQTGLPGWQTSDDPEHWNSWRRESLAYRTGFASRAYADAGIAAPGLLDLQDRPDGSVALWLRDMAGTPGTAWSVTRLGTFARQLGRAQSRWIGRVPGRAELPWLSRDWLPGYLADRRTPDDPPWDHPATDVWPRRLREALPEVWRRRHDLLAVARDAPRTLCHLDVWPMNLIDADGTTVLLDWAFTGEGAVGEDVANLVIDSVADGLIDEALFPEIADTVTAQYLQGLADGGCAIGADEVVRAIAATGAAKYSWLAPAMVSRAASTGTVANGSYGVHGSLAELFTARIGLLGRIADWADAVLT